jgi:4-amino-4-deoxy-L-arabinose transferase-like glycosyltransferase
MNTPPPPRRDLQRKTALELTAVAGLFLAAFVIRATDLSVLVAFPDDLTYASRTFQLVGENWVWPISQMWDQPPLMVYLLSVVFVLFGGALDTLRMLSVVAGSVSVVIAYYLGRSMYGRWAGFIAAVTMAINGFAILYSRVIYIEALASMLILGATFLFWEGIVKKRDLKLAIAGGVVYGLALDAKYVSLVMGVALVVFLIWYWNRFRFGFPGKEVAAYFGVAFLCMLPVLVDLAINNVNPFFWDLVYRFQIAQSSSFVGSVVSGKLISVGFTHFVELLFHVSSTRPFQIFPLITVDIIIWSVIVAAVIAFFAVSFVLRWKTQDGLLLILFVALLGFAFLYPDRRTYFLIYPAVIFFLMVGRVGQWGIDHSKRTDRRVVAVAATMILCMTVVGVAVNATAVPLMYQNGFGDWDEITPIVQYIAAHHAPDSYMATTRLQVAVYLALDHVNVTVLDMRGPSNINSLPVLNQTLETPYIGIYPTFWVISAASVEKIHPQFIVIPISDYVTLTTEFQRFINQNYYQPINTNLVLLYEIRAGNFTGLG